MGVIWRKIENGEESGMDDSVAGAVPCVVGTRHTYHTRGKSRPILPRDGFGFVISRVYLVGGSSTKRNDPDIFLSVYTLSYPGPHESEGEGPPGNGHATTDHTTTTLASIQARLARTDGASQEGDVPPARIGHAAVVDHSRSAIVVFGGEATSSAAVVPFAKLSDAYEGIPKEPSGTLVWRALHVDPASPTMPNGKGRPAAAGSDSTGKAPEAVAFHAACAASMHDQWAMIAHGGVDQNEDLREDMWALRCRRNDENKIDGCGNKAVTFFWERLTPEGQGPPPMAYHSASPVNGGKIVVFLGGDNKGSEAFCGSSVFLLDTVGGEGNMTWSSLSVAGLLRRQMHSAVLVTVAEAQRKEVDELDIASSGAHASGRNEPAIRLWSPTSTVASVTPGGVEVDAGTDGARAGREGNLEPQDGGAPAFESILIFGGITDGRIIGEPTLLGATGTLEKLPLGRSSLSTPECRYNHAMVPVRGGREVLLFGGCRGDGTRLRDSFVLDLNVPVTLDNGDVYTGQRDPDGRRHGEGTCEYAGSDRGSYTGQWEADEPHGRGERIYPTRGQHRENLLGVFGPGAPPMASYKGEWKRGARDGNGVCTFASVSTPRAGEAAATVPDSYEGEWVGGMPFGKGVLRWRATKTGSSGSTAAAALGGNGCGSIDGEWTEEGLVRGRETLPGKGGVYEGQYRLGKRHGHGRLELLDGSEFEGTWRNGRPNGIGTFRCGVTRQVYIGKWVGGVRCGRGECQYASGSRYEGLWLDGKKHGEGVLVSPAGGSLRGVWCRDELLPPAPTPEIVSET